MATVVTFNIAGATATWDSQAAGANLVFAADKEDTGTERTVDEASEYACEVWANSVDTAFDQINEAFNGTRTLTALAVGGAVVADANNDADEAVFGDTGSSTDHGITIFSPDTRSGNIYFGDSSSSIAGRFEYDHNSPRFRWFVENDEKLELLPTALRPDADAELDLGASGGRFNTLYAYDGDFSDDVTVSGDLDQDGASPIRTIGDGTGAPSEQIAKADGSVAQRDWRTGGTAAGDRAWTEQISATDHDYQLLRFEPVGTFADVPFQIERSSGNAEFANDVTVGGDVAMGSGGPILTVGSGSPESAVTADVGSIYMRTDGGASTSIYVKESGTGNTGWVAK